MRSGFFNVGVLAASGALAFAATPMMMLMGSLLGVELAPSEDLATLPIALMVIGTAVGIVPATQLMHWLGRKYALCLFMALAVAACLIAGHGLAIKRFSLFCVGAGILGLTNAALQQIRFAAMESVDLKQGVTAASIVMLSGVVAAIVGPELAVAGRHLTAVEYQGSFWLVAVSSGLAAVVLLLYTPPVSKQGVARGRSSRPVGDLLKNRSFCLAVASATIGAMVMTFVMTATPISMHSHHGYSLMDTKWVIQSHIVAMFLPSLISPWLFRLMGLRGMMIAGLCCYVISVCIGLVNTEVVGFWVQLILLGIGWNFLFVAGTALLPSTYQEGDQFKAQAFNDGTVFSIQALASLSAGWAISNASWQVMLLVCLLPIALMVAIMVWSARAEKDAVKAYNL